MQDETVRASSAVRDERGKQMAEGSAAARFLTLFQSNPRSFGRWNPANGKMMTEHKQYEPEDVERHISGDYGLGLVPILDNSTCKWGAIDIDNHGEDVDIPIGPIDQKLAAYPVPLIPCRSKSGGVHVYAFFKELWPVRKVQELLAKAAQHIRYPDAEIFPKQHSLNGTGKMRYGNWLNMPYLDGDDTVRYAYLHGRKLTLDEFLAWAESHQIDKEKVVESVANDHSQAPPCIQRMLVEGVGQGQRNEAIYNITVYGRRRDPDNYREWLQEVNRSAFEKPLGNSELNRTVASAARPEMKYRCNEEPIKSLCDRAACLKRKYGVVPEDAQRPLPEFTNLIKHMTDPIRWEFSLDGVKVTNIATEELLDWAAMRHVIAERLMIVPPYLKKEEWNAVLTPLMATARIEEAPEDASTAGIIRARLRDFAARAHDLKENRNPHDRQALLRGLPIIATIGGIKSIAFRSQDFVNYLKRTKSEELRGTNLWFAVKDLGLQTTRMRTGGSKSPMVHVWYVPYKEIDLRDPEPDDLEIKSEV